MSTSQTTNLHLTKAVKGTAEPISIDSINGNLDILDEAVGGLQESVTLLWENPNPDVNFTAQSISFSKSAAAYDAFLVEFNITSTNVTSFFEMMRKGRVHHMNAVFGAYDIARGPLTQYTRTVTASSDTVMTFGDAYTNDGTNQSVNNASHIPLRIYGIKLAW